MRYRHRKVKTLEERYGEARIKIADNGVTYEVLLDKFVSYMSRHLNRNEYKDISNHRLKMDHFFIELNENLKDNSIQRMAPGCNSGKTFERYFDPLVKGRPMSDKYKKQCMYIIKDFESFFNTQFLSSLQESLCKKNRYIHSLIFSFA